MQAAKRVKGSEQIEEEGDVGRISRDNEENEVDYEEDSTSKEDTEGLAQNSFTPSTKTIGDPSTLHRNKRMFGALMGHLDLARKRLQRDTDSSSGILSRQQQIVEGAKLRNEELSKQVKLLSEAARLENLERVDNCFNPLL